MPGRHEGRSRQRGPRRNRKPASESQARVARAAPRIRMEGSGTRRQQNAWGPIRVQRPRNETQRIVYRGKFRPAPREATKRDAGASYDASVSAAPHDLAQRGSFTTTHQQATKRNAEASQDPTSSKRRKRIRTRSGMFGRETAHHKARLSKRSNERIQSEAAKPQKFPSGPHCELRP